MTFKKAFDHASSNYAFVEESREREWKGGRGGERRGEGQKECEGAGERELRGKEGMKGELVTKGGREAS